MGRSKPPRATRLARWVSPWHSALLALPPYRVLARDARLLWRIVAPAPSAPALRASDGVTFVTWRRHPMAIVTARRVHVLVPHDEDGTDTPERRWALGLGMTAALFLHEGRDWDEELAARETRRALLPTRAFQHWARLMTDREIASAADLPVSVVRARRADADVRLCDGRRRAESRRPSRTRQ